MLAVEKWAKDKHPTIAIIAPQIASIGRELPDLYRNLKNHHLANAGIELPDLPTWYSLYRSHKRYINIFGQFLINTSPLAQSFTDISSDTKPDWERIQATSIEEMRTGFDKRPLDQDTWTTTQRHLHSHRIEIEFFLFVYFPCLHLYQTSPGRLYHKARLGDIKALDQLLRLDPFMLHDPAIGHQIQKIRLFGKTAAYINLVEAPMKPIKAKISRNRIKASLGAYISHLAESIGQPLTSTEIRKLFDAIAQDADNRDIDTNLPDSPEAFSKAIQRNKSDWKKLTHPDKKR